MECRGSSKGWGQDCIPTKLPGVTPSHQAENSPYVPPDMELPKIIKRLPKNNNYKLKELADIPEISKTYLIYSPIFRSTIIQHSPRNLL